MSGNLAHPVTFVGKILNFAKLQNAVSFLAMCSTYSSAYSSDGSQDWKQAAEICFLLSLFYITDLNGLCGTFQSRLFCESVIAESCLNRSLKGTEAILSEAEQQNCQTK